MHAFGLSHAQIMQQYTKEVKELALSNGPVILAAIKCEEHCSQACGRIVDEAPFRPHQRSYVDNIKS